MPGSFRFKLLPDCEFFSQGSFKWVDQVGLKLHLDLSDLVDWYTYFQVKEPVHESLISLISQGSIVFDVGANIGVTALKSAQKVGLPGRVVAFEASLETFQRLLENCTANPHLKVTPIQKAVGAERGRINLKNRKSHNSGMNQVMDGGRIERIRIDDFVNETQLFPSVIKLDIEGYELKALIGAENLLRQYRPHLLIEVDRDNLSHFGDSPEQLRDFLKDLGYSFYRLNGDLMVDSDFSDIKHEDLIAKAS